jgi:hypothetical protein
MGLADEIRRKIAAGELPSSRPAKIWYGSGDGRPCSGCGDPVHRSQVRYEFELAMPGQDLAASDYSFHIGCFGLWEAELRRRSV